jgi:SSS family solute:Na+ symporter
MLGTILSGMVGYTLVSGATVGREIVARLHSGLQDAAIKNWTRAGFALACLFAVFLALLVHSVVDLWYAWSGAVVGALLLPVALSYGLLWKSRASSAWIFAATAVSFLGSVGWLAYGLRTDNPYLTVPIFGWSFSLGTLLPGLAVSGLIIGAGEAFCRRRR